MLSVKRIGYRRRKRLLREMGYTRMDELNRYRGFFKLHGREKTLRRSKGTKYKKSISQGLISLMTDVGRYRTAIKDIVEKNEKYRCVYETVHEDNSGIRSRLDKLYYEKRKKARLLFDLQLERETLFLTYQRQEDVCASDRLQQRLITRFQRAAAKQNAAKAIRSTYLTMRDVLRKDAGYFDSVPKILEEDQNSQCGMMLKTIVVGQLAAEDLDDARKNYKQSAKKVLRDMKEREIRLNIVREYAQDLWGYARSLIRIESDISFPRRDIHIANTECGDILESQMSCLKGMLDEIKRSLLLNSHRDLLLRLGEQARRKAWLLAQFDNSVEKRDSLLIKANLVGSTLTTLRHSLVGTTSRYQSDNRTLLERINVQREREIYCQNLKKIRGELLMCMREALQNMLSMLICIKRVGKTIKKFPREHDEKRLMAKSIDTKDDIVREQKDIKGTLIDDLSTTDKMEIDGLALLSSVTRKLGAVFGICAFELDTDRQERAKDLYQTYVSNYRTALILMEDNQESTELFVEHEAIDSSVPTRIDVKLSSKLLAENNFI